MSFAIVCFKVDFPEDLSYDDFKCVARERLNSYMPDLANFGGNKERYDPARKDDLPTPLSPYSTTCRPRSPIASTILDACRMRPANNSATATGVDGVISRIASNCRMQSHRQKEAGGEIFMRIGAYLTQKPYPDWPT